MKQLAIKFRSWGGKRKGAGRKPKGARAGVPHVPRKQSRRTPAHITMRVGGGRPSLRGSRSFRAIQECFRKGKERFGLRVIHFTVQGNHLHLLVEAEDALALTRGIKGLSVRMARALNKAHGMRGPGLPRPLPLARPEEPAGGGVRDAVRAQESHEARALELERRDGSLLVRGVRTRT